MGAVAFFPNGTQFRRGPGYGTSAFITHNRLKSRDFIKGDDVYILLTVEGRSVKIVVYKIFLLLSWPLFTVFFWVPLLGMGQMGISGIFFFV